MAMGNARKFTVGTVAVDVERVFELCKRTPARHTYDGITMATVFTTQSVRTRTSFERAAMSMGMKVISVTERRDGEPLEDFGYAIGCVSELCVTRLEQDGDFEQFTKHAKTTGLTVIDGGCGTVSHPTQAIIDLYTLRRAGVELGSKITTFGPINNRAMHSFMALAKEYYEIVPYGNVKECAAVYCVTTGNRLTLPQDLKCFVMHPFPRGSVVPSCYDFTPQDLYHGQMRLAVMVRRAIIQQIMEQSCAE